MDELLLEVRAIKNNKNGPSTRKCESDQRNPGVSSELGTDHSFGWSTAREPSDNAGLKKNKGLPPCYFRLLSGKVLMLTFATTHLMFYLHR